MNAVHLIDHYSYAADMCSVILCLTILILIHFALYFSADVKFKYLKRSLYCVLIAALSNLAFSLVCRYIPDRGILIFLFRDVHHGGLMWCMYLFIRYIKHMLDDKGRLSAFVMKTTRIVFVVCFALDICSPITHIGFYKQGELWYDPLASFYNLFYLYGMLVLLGMLVRNRNRLIRPVRICLVITQLLVIIIMIKSGLDNINSFTSFTYVMPIIVVMILLHSKPFDDETGAMNEAGFDSYVDKYVKNQVVMDYMVLQLKLNIENKIPHELGMVLATFWHKYFVEASLFAFRNDVFLLAVPRIKKNGKTDDKVILLLQKVFPKYVEQFNIPYKVIGLTDIDFPHSGMDIKNIVNYLFVIMEDNDLLIVDEILKNQLRIMRSVKETLMDIEKKAIC